MFSSIRQGTRIKAGVLCGAHTEVQSVPDQYFPSLAIRQHRIGLLQKSMLVEKYEAQHYPLPSPDPIEFLSYAMESRGLTRKDLEAYIGAVAAWPRC